MPRINGSEHRPDSRSIVPRLERGTVSSIGSLHAFHLVDGSTARTRRRFDALRSTAVELASSIELDLGTIEMHDLPRHTAATCRCIDGQRRRHVADWRVPARLLWLSHRVRSRPYPHTSVAHVLTSMNAIGYWAAASRAPAP